MVCALQYSIGHLTGQGVLDLSDESVQRGDRFSGADPAQCQCRFMGNVLLIRIEQNGQGFDCLRAPAHAQGRDDALLRLAAGLVQCVDQGVVHCRALQVREHDQGHVTHLWVSKVGRQRRDLFVCGREHQEAADKLLGRIGCVTLQDTGTAPVQCLARRRVGVRA